MEKLWTTAEVARFLGVNETDVEGLVKQGRLTGYKLGGQFLRFRPDQVQVLKRAAPVRAVAAAAAIPPGDAWRAALGDFLYFYDFYLVSAFCLAIVVVYLIASG